MGLAAVDAQVHRIPRVVTWPAHPALAAWLVAASWANGDWLALRRAAWVAALMWGGYYVLHRLARRRGLGRGDVTLAGLIGGLLGWFGWEPALVAAWLTFVLAGLSAGALVLTRRAAEVPRAQAIYEQGLNQGQSFDQIERALVALDRAPRRRSHHPVHRAGVEAALVQRGLQCLHLGPRQGR